MNAEHDGTFRHGLCSQESGPKYGPEMGPSDGPNSEQFVGIRIFETELDTSVPIVVVFTRSQRIGRFACDFVAFIPEVSSKLVRRSSQKFLLRLASVHCRNKVYDVREFYF